MQFNSSAYLSRALHRLLSRLDLPHLTLPFNIIVTCIYASWIPFMADEVEIDSDFEIDWAQAAKGVLLSVSQVRLHFESVNTHRKVYGVLLLLHCFM